MSGPVLFSINLPCSEHCDCGPAGRDDRWHYQFTIGELFYELRVPWCRGYVIGLGDHRREMSHRDAAELFCDTTGYRMIQTGGREREAVEPPFPRVQPAVVMHGGRTLVLEHLLQEAWLAFREQSRCEVCGRMPSIEEARSRRWNKTDEDFDDELESDASRNSKWTLTVADGDDVGPFDILDALADLLIDMEPSPIPEGTPFRNDHIHEFFPSGHAQITHSFCSMRCTRKYNDRHEKLRAAINRTRKASGARALEEFLNVGAIHELVDKANRDDSRESHVPQ